MAKGREGLSSWRTRQASTAAISSAGILTPIVGLIPVRGLPLRFFASNCPCRVMDYLLAQRRAGGKMQLSTGSNPVNPLGGQHG